MRRRAAVRWLVYGAIAIAFAVACAFLSNWQFSRNTQREAQLALIAANYDAEPVPLDALIPAGAPFDPEDQWHPVILHGEYLAEDQLLARNRAHGGSSAYEVLVPLRMDDGRVVIVNRGWVPPGEKQPEPDAIPAPPSGEVTVVARLAPGEPLPRSGRTAPEGQVPTINLPLIATTIGTGDVLDSAYGMLVSEDPAPAAAPNPLESPSEDPGPHLSYAIQWILFAIMAFVFLWYMIRTELKHRREDAEERATATGIAPDARPAARSSARQAPRRRDRDAEEEDALLDGSPR